MGPEELLAAVEAMFGRSGAVPDLLTVLVPGTLDEAQRLARPNDSDGGLPTLFAALEAGGHTCSAILDGRRPAGIRAAALPLSQSSSSTLPWR
jgi:hypothetical protein